MTGLEHFTIEEQTDALQELIRDRWSRSLFTFAKQALGYKDLQPSTHLKITKALESNTKRKLIVLPRGTFKSSLVCVAYPLWRLLFKNPNEAILIDSEIYSNSKNFIREIKAHAESPIMQMFFPNLKGSTWGEGEITLSLRSAPRKEASITAGGVNTVKVGQHYDVIISDDLNSNNNSRSKEGRTKVVDHYQYNKAILDGSDIYVVCGTRYAIDDVIGHIIANEIDECDKISLGLTEGGLK